MGFTSSGSGTSIGSGASIGNGATLNPGRGGVKTPSGDTIDQHTKKLVVDTIDANLIKTKIADADLGTITTLAVKNLYVGKGRIDVEKRFDEIGKQLTNILTDLANKADKSDIPSTPTP